MIFKPSDGEYFNINGESVAPGSLYSRFETLTGSVLLEFLKSRVIWSWTRPEFIGYDGFELDKINISNMLSNLPEAIHLDVGLDSPTRFQTDVGASLCGFLGIPVLHGWLVDPDKEPDLYNAVGSEYVSGLYAKCTNPETSPLEADLISHFLTDTEGTQLTPYGLDALRREVKVGEGCVLYVNNHYRVIYNRLGTLFYLVTDPDMSCEHVWKSLELVDDEGFYVTDGFVPTPIQKNIEKAKKWAEEDLGKTVRAIGLEAQKQTQTDAAKKNRGKKNRRKNRKKQEAGTAGEDKSADGQEIDSASDTGPGRTNSDHGSATARDHYHEMEANDIKFLDFLENFKRGGSEKPYFEGMEKLMHHLEILDVAIPFGFMKEHDKTMAMFIQDNYQSIHERLRQLVASYLVDLNLHVHLELEAVHVVKHVKLEITDLPEPKCTQSYEDFISDNELWNGVSTSYTGRKMSNGFLNYILHWFGKGKCWGGGWNKSDMEVRNNGRDFVITKIPELDITKNRAYKDLLKFIEVVLKAFENKAGEFPPYFDEFQVDVLQIPDPHADPEKWWNFLKLMRSHFALKAPLVRSAFLCNVFRIADSLRHGMPPMAPIFAPFKSRSGLGDWRISAREIGPLRDVYYYKNFRFDKWEHNHWCLIQFTRHSIEHILNYTKKNNLVQEIRDIAIVDLILAKRIGIYIAQFVRFFIYTCGSDVEFSSAFRHLDASECFDDEQGSEAHIDALLNEILKSHKQDPKDAPSSTPSSSVLFPCDLSIAAIQKAFEDESFQVEFLNGELRCAGKITVRKADSRNIIVKGEICQDYYIILGVITTMVQGGQH